MTKQVVGQYLNIAALLEAARKEKRIGSGQDALVTIAPGPFADLLETHAREIRDALIVSGIAVNGARRVVLDSLDLRGGTNGVSGTRGASFDLAAARARLAQLAR